MAGNRAGMGYMGTDIPLQDRMITPAQHLTSGMVQPPDPGGGYNFGPAGQGEMPQSIPNRPVAAPPIGNETDGMEDAMDTIMERAERYMGMTPEQISALDPQGWEQLMQDLAAGYPDDMQLQQALESTRGVMGASAGAEMDRGDALGQAVPPDMSFRPDQY